MFEGDEHCSRGPSPSGTLIASFATGIANYKAAVHAAITQPWSNGQEEADAQARRTPTYGRAKLDLLQARLIGTP